MPYSGNFSRTIYFAVFVGLLVALKINPSKYVLFTLMLKNIVNNANKEMPEILLIQ